jgi:hypothetical protein
MRKAETVSRDSLSWAGSYSGCRGASEGLIPETMGRDIYKLHEIRHKLEDDSYVDDAVTGIAEFLTDTLKKKEGHER